MDSQARTSLGHTVGAWVLVGLILFVGVIGSGSGALALALALVVWVGAGRGGKSCLEALGAVDIALCATALSFALPLTALGALTRFEFEPVAYFALGPGLVWGCVEVLRRQAYGYIVVMAAVVVPLASLSAEVGPGLAALGGAAASYCAIRFLQERTYSRRFRSENPRPSA